MKRMPAQKPGRSKQDYGTPPAFINAVQNRFGLLSVDLAAHSENAVCSDYVTERENSLNVDWRKFGGVAWLNPPFENIDPWAAKCAREASPHLKILFLVPASVGSNWFADHIHRKAFVLGLSPRLTFVGETHPYPKDLILAGFGFGVSGFDLWRWKP